MLKYANLPNLKRASAGLVLCTLLLGCHSKQDAQTAPAATAASTPLLSIPLQRNGQWVVEAQGADNRSLPLLLDTGATLNALPEQGPLAATPITKETEAALLKQGALNSPTGDGTLSAGTLSDPRQFKLGISPALRIQNWSMPAGAPALLGDLGRVASVDDAPVKGIIGSETMRNLTWRADYVDGHLTAYSNEAPAHEWQQCTFMALDPQQRTPIISLSLDGESRFFILDTGYDADVAIPADMFDVLVQAKRFPNVGTVSGIDVTNRVSHNRQGLLAGLTIGQKTLPKLVVSDASQDPRIGLGTLEKMDRFELDFRRNRFCFDLPAAPRDSAITPPSSVLLRAGERYEIASLAPDGRLARSGAKVGDLITQVGQTSVAKLDLGPTIELLSNPATGQVSVLRDNRTLVIKLMKSN